MKRKLRIAATCLALLAGVPLLGGRGQEPRKLDDGVQKKVSELMQKKLKYAQKVLEGIALGEFDKIADNAEDLILVSKALEWQVVKSPQYEVHSNEFRRAAEGLAQRAREKNLDGAALAYVDMTLSCVKCHKYVRGVRMTRLDDSDPAVFTPSFAR
jgi:hypothetical protein